MSERGVTLFELLAVLALIGLIAMFAIPAYRHHLLRVHRAEAMTALSQLQSAQESHFLRHDTYTADVTAPPPAGLGLAVASTTNKYLLSIALAADGQTFIATASPTGAQLADVECLAFSIDARGRRGVSGAGGTERCWK